MSAPVAVVDLGTNTALLLVARRGERGALETLDEISLTPRLGAGLAARGVLDPRAQERALAALAEFAARIARHGVAPARVRAVGTAVLRRAGDGAEFARRAARATGLPLEILSEAEEARLGALAVAAEGTGPGAAVVVDVGGGSTEVACAALGLRASAPVGALVLTETYLGDAPLRPGGWPALRAAAGHAAQVFPAGCARGRACVAIGGTAVNLGCLAAGLARFDHRRAEGVIVPAARVAALADEIAAFPPEGRLRLPIEPERAEILPAGLACLFAAADRIGAGGLCVTGRGLRHGIARELLGPTPPEGNS